MRLETKISINKRALFAASLLIFSLFFMSTAAKAQAQDDDAQVVAGQNDQQRNLRDLLNLTSQQREQIRQIQESNKEDFRAARQQLKQAQRALDEATYADTVNEAVIEDRAREVATAQAALIRLHAVRELKIRRVLTADQLNTLRALRQQARANQRERRLDNGFGVRQQQQRRRDRLNARPDAQLQRDNLNQQRNNNINRQIIPPRERRGAATRRQRP